MESLCFIFNVYQDEDRAKILTQQLKSTFPNAEIIGLLDGKPSGDIASYLEASLVRQINGLRLKPQVNGGAWLERIFKVYLEESRADHLVKIEPDSTVFRAFANISDTDIAGTLIQIVDGRELVHGGCVAIKREAVEKIVRSRLLENPKYKFDRRFGYRRYEPPYLQVGEVRSNEWIISGDAVLADLIQELNLSVQNWAEVSCGVYPREIASDKWAVFHPKKFSSIRTLSVENQPNWDGLLSDLRGSTYFAKVYAAAERNTTIQAAYTTTLSTLNSRNPNLNDLSFSLSRTRATMGELLTSSDIADVNNILLKHNFPINI